MTVAPVRPTPAQRSGAEALIEEARRLHRRRRWRWGTLAVAVATVAGVVMASAHGDRSAPSASPPRPGPVVPRAHVVPGPSVGAATAASLTGPVGVAVDGADNVFFTDGNRVYEVDRATQQLLVVAGTGVNGSTGDGGPATSAELSLPVGVALAPNGDVYVEDGTNRIRTISATTGIISAFAGDGHVGDTGNGGPAVSARLDLMNGAGGSRGFNAAIAVGPTGDLYIADGGNNEIRKVSPATAIITDVAGTGRRGSSGDGGPATRAALCSPVGVAVDRSSDIFIATACGSIREVSGATGLISTILGAHQDPALAGGGGDHDPLGLAVGGDGKLIVTEAYGRRVLEIDPATHRVTLVAGTGSETLWTTAATAGDGGPAPSATFGLPLGVAADGQGNIFVADSFDDAIREIGTSSGLITLVEGQIPDSPAAGHCC